MLTTLISEMQKSLITSLSLAYPPISNYAFNFVKNEEEVQQWMDRGHLYMIAQRPELKFQNIEFVANPAIISFEVGHALSDKRASGKIYLDQVRFLKSKEGEYEIQLGSFDPQRKFEGPPFYDVDGLKFYSAEGEFLHWLTPEKLFYQYSHGMPGVEGLAGFRDLMLYKIHYIGIATEEPIRQRLTGHEKLQEILGVEYPLGYKSLPTHEIVLLLLMVEETLDIVGLEDINDLELSLFEKHRNSIDHNKISRDAEKAFVHLLNPEYNIKKYSNYPKSSDGLFDEKYDSFAYILREELTIECRGQRIAGSLEIEKSDMILIKDNTKAILIQER
jgi:hypothetical protein